MSHALVLAPLDDDGTVPAPAPADLPSTPSTQRDWLTEQVGGWAVAAHYHPHIDFHANDAAYALHLPFNPIAWALASV